MVSWGIVTICTAAVSSYTGLIVCRIFLGIAEAGFFVSSCLSFIVYLVGWWTAQTYVISPVSFVISVSGTSLPSVAQEWQFFRLLLLLQG